MGESFASEVAVDLVIELFYKKILRVEHNVIYKCGWKKENVPLRRILVGGGLDGDYYRLSRFLFLVVACRGLESIRTLGRVM